MFGFYIFIKSFERIGREIRSERRGGPKSFGYKTCSELEAEHKQARWEAEHAEEIAAAKAEEARQAEVNFWHGVALNYPGEYGVCVQHPTWEKNVWFELDKCPYCNPNQEIDVPSVVNQATALMTAGHAPKDIAGFIARRTGLDEATVYDKILTAIINSEEDE